MSPTTSALHVVEVDLEGDLPELKPGPADDGTVLTGARILVRRAGEPLGVVLIEIPPDGLSAVELEGRLRSGLAAELAAHPAGEFAAAHAAHLARAPRCTVVICTREHPDALRTALASLTHQDHPDFAVLVVDNAPTTTATREVVEEFTGALDLRYLVEPRPGLSRARNAALRSPLDGEIVAWLDDDESADPLWLSELTRAFEDRPEVLAVSGSVQPAELASVAQVWFEQFGGHSKGRGFTAQEFSPATRRRQHPLFPLPPFGVGANMAFRTRALRRFGFDEALGAGTATQGGEDTKIFSDLLLAGATVRYWPTAITRHYHRRDVEGLARQLVGYGTGLTAYYTACVLQRPSRLITLAALAPSAVRAVLSSGGEREATLGPDFPREMLAANRRAMLGGPWAYLRTRAAQWRQGRRQPSGSRSRARS